MTTSESTVSTEDLVARAEAMVPKLRDRALETERNGRVLDDQVADFRDAGFFRMATPLKYGGHGLGVDTVAWVGEELARGCGSSAWVATLLAVHSWMGGLLPIEAQEELWDSTPDAIIVDCFDPSGATVEPADGGVTLSGRWSLVSGCHHADWAYLGAIGPAGPVMYLVPARELNIVDNWYVSGLRGTGSNDVTLEPTFVPDHRTLSLVDAELGRTPGSELYDSPFYKLPLLGFFSSVIVAVAVGTARGALEVFADRERSRIAPILGDPVSERPSLQNRLAESAAEIDAARLILRSDVAELAERITAGEEYTPEWRARVRRNHAFATRLCLNAVNRIFEVSGGHSLYDENHLQRFHRDLHAISHHLAVQWDPVAEQFGRIHLGLGLGPSGRFI